MSNFKISPITAFDNYDLISLEPGLVKLTTTVSQTALNYYGAAHGGYLFTLADQTAGLVTLSLGKTAVTLQANINYLRPGQLGDQLLVTGQISHDGRTTKLVEVTITDPDHKPVCKASFTMFVTGEGQLKPN